MNNNSNTLSFITSYKFHVEYLNEVKRMSFWFIIIFFYKSQKIRISHN